MNNIDLKLVSIVSELLRTHNVSAAAENLGISQSSVSMALAKLRKHFGDPLFVRTSRGMEPTPYAMDLAADLAEAQRILNAALERRAVFNPANSDRMFRLCSTDIAQFTILPALLKRLQEVAPAVRIDLQQLGDDTPRLLEAGEADLAIGLVPKMGGGFYQQKLYTGRFVCAVRADHPRIKNSLTLAQYEAETHLAVTTFGGGYQGLEKTLATQNVRRKIGMRVPSFLGVPRLIAASDFLAIVPERLGRLLSEGKNMKLLPLPFSLPTFTVTQNWHERYNLDPAHQWLRGVVAGLFRDDGTVKDGAVK